MKIAIVSIDSRGGIQPYLALALGLREAEHDVRMVVPSNAVPFVAEHRVTAMPLSVDIQQLLRNVGVGVGNRRALMRAMLSVVTDGVGRWMEEARAGCAGVDLVMAGASGGFVGRSAAEALGVPFVEAHLQPLGQATTAFPGIYAPYVPGWLGGPGRWASHAYTNLMISAPLLPAVRRARVATLGLPAKFPPEDPRGPVLYGYSRHVLPPPRSWSERRRVTGYWTLPLPSTWSPPRDLEAFLVAGPPPVCFGFGSMPTDDPAALGDLLVGAARQVGARSVLLSGWGGLETAVADDVCVVDAVPHEWLFPRVAAVIHHGGAGTTGASARGRAGGGRAPRRRPAVLGDARRRSRRRPPPDPEKGVDLCRADRSPRAGAE